MPLPDLEAALARAGTSGWDFFDTVPAEVRERVDLRNALDEEKRRVIASAWANFAATPDGAQALLHLFSVTTDKTVFFVNLGQGTKKMAKWGCFREGQNSVAAMIERLVSMGRNEEKPKPRDQL